jgi:hypothetical protein
MKKQFLLLFLVSIVPPAGTLAQVTQPPLSLKARTERGLQRSDLQAFLDASKAEPTETTDVGLAIIAAGNTNDTFWIPYIEPFLKYAHNRFREVAALAGAAQLALAKLGEPAQLQEIACEANFGSASIRYVAITQKLKYVQGWFAVSILANWIEDNPKRNQLLLDRPSDEIFWRPQEVAFKILPDVVPNPPNSAPPESWMETRDEEKLAPLRQAWREWINKNEESLHKLTPVGDGLDLSRSTCKHVLAHDQHFDRSNLK